MSHDGFPPKNDDVPEPRDVQYSLTTAVGDLKKGITYYQNKKWKLALPLITQAEKKFRKENQAKLILECNFLLANIRLQLQHYSDAIKNYFIVEQLALKLNQPQYHQQALFNLGYLHYKEQDYNSARKCFQQLSSADLRYINTFHYETFMGRTLLKLKNYKEGIEILLNAVKHLELSIQDKRQNNHVKENKVQLAHLFSEIGRAFFEYNMNEIKHKGFQLFQSDEFSQRINQSIEFYLKSIEIWEELEEKGNQIEIYQIIANIYGYLDDQTLQIHYLQKALEITEIQHDFQKMVGTLRNITQNYIKENRHQEITSLLLHILDVFSSHVYIDQDVIAEFQYDLGYSLFHLEENEPALKQLFASLNIYQQKKIPVQAQLDTLDLIIQIYSKLGDNEKAAYYQQIKDKAKEKIQSLTFDQLELPSILKDLWIFTQTGIEIYSYHPNMELNPTLFGGFVSALQSLSQEITKESLKSFVIGNSRYTFYLEPKENLYILGRSFISTPETQVQELLKLINEKFYEKYERHIENFTGNVSMFADFDKILTHLV